MKAKIDGGFVEITWQEGDDKKTLLITPKDIVANYYAAQLGRATDAASPTATRGKAKSSASYTISGGRKSPRR